MQCCYIIKCESHADLLMVFEMRYVVCCDDVVQWCGENHTTGCCAKSEELWPGYWPRAV